VPTVWSSVRITITFGGTAVFGGTVDAELADPRSVQLVSTPITNVRAKNQRPTRYRRPTLLLGSREVVQGLLTPAS
jgi:hypothetical protein